MEVYQSMSIESRVVSIAGPTRHWEMSDRTSVSIEAVHVYLWRQDELEVDLPEL